MGDGVATSYGERRVAFRNASLAAWRDLVSELLGNNDIARWTDPQIIAEVLERIARKAPLNHCFLPGSGGLDLQRAHFQDAEEDCVELLFDVGPTLVQPAALELVRTAEDTLDEWTYFRLDCLRLLPRGPSWEAVDDREETVVELEPGRYAPRKAWDDGYYYDLEFGCQLDLPDDARLLKRQLRGSFVIFAKGSTYNAISDAYQGQHDVMETHEFAAFIRQLVLRLQEQGLYGTDLMLGGQSS